MQIGSKGTKINSAGLHELLQFFHALLGGFHSLPFIRFLEKMVCAIFKEVVDEEDKDIVEISVLDDRFIAHPTVAIEQAKTVLCSMAHMAQKNLIRSMELLDTFSQEKYDKIQRREDKVDRYEDKLGTYLVKITQQELTSGQNKEVSKLLHTISDFEENK